jgi:hypothetical protein
MLLPNEKPRTAGLFAVALSLWRWWLIRPGRQLAVKVDAAGIDILSVQFDDHLIARTFARTGGKGFRWRLMALVLLARWWWHVAVGGRWRAVIGTGDTHQQQPA